MQSLHDSFTVAAVEAFALLPVIDALALAPAKVTAWTACPVRHADDMPRGEHHSCSCCRCRPFPFPSPSSPSAHRLTASVAATAAATAASATVAAKAATLRLRAVHFFPFPFHDLQHLVALPAVLALS